MQYTRGAWLWKLEGVVRSGEGNTFGAVVGGTEYTIFDIGQSDMDLGLLAEYHYDGRDNDAPVTFYDKDIFLGARLAFNDVDDTSLIAGIIVDVNNRETVAYLEAQRRIGERWKLEAEMRLLTNVSQAYPLAGIARDSFVTLRAAWYF